MLMKVNAIRHYRILDIRSKITRGWNMESLMGYCRLNLKVSKQTADSYIDEAAAPFRKKFQEKIN